MEFRGGNVDRREFAVRRGTLDLPPHDEGTYPHRHLCYLDLRRDIASKLYRKCNRTSAAQRDRTYLLYSARLDLCRACRLGRPAPFTDASLIQRYSRHSDPNGGRDKGDDCDERPDEMHTFPLRPYLPHVRRRLHPVPGHHYIIYRNVD